MSDARLAGNGVTWEYQEPGRNAPSRFVLGHTDFELELLFQTAHEAWTRGRLEARRGKVGEVVYMEDVNAFHEAMAANRLAFGGRLSLEFLASPAGSLEYVLLKLQKGSASGGARVTRDLLERLQRDDRPAWDALLNRVLVADFPNVFRVVLPSPAQATPPPSTGDSSSSSQASPG